MAFLLKNTNNLLKSPIIYFTGNVKYPICKLTNLTVSTILANQVVLV